MHTFLLAAKRDDKGDITEVNIVTVSRNKALHFPTDDKMTASQRAAKWFRGQTPIKGADTEEPPAVRVLGLDVYRDLQQIWLTSILPSAEGSYPYALPRWFPWIGEKLDELLFRDGQAWPDFLRSRGLSVPQDWKGPGTDIDFDIRTVAALGLQLQFLDSTIKSEAKPEMVIGDSEATVKTEEPKVPAEAEDAS